MDDQIDPFLAFVFTNFIVCYVGSLWGLLLCWCMMNVQGVNISSMAYIGLGQGIDQKLVLFFMHQTSLGFYFYSWIIGGTFNFSPR